MRSIGFLFCLCAPAFAPVAAQDPALPRVALVGDTSPPAYAQRVAKLLAGRAIVLTPQTEDPLAWAREHRPDVIHIHHSKALRDEDVAQLPKQTSLVLATLKPIPTRDGSI